MPSPDATRPAAHTAHAARVLVIDDDPAFGDVVVFMLARMGIAAEAVQTFEQAAGQFGRAGDPPPGAVVLDWRLGERDGLELIAPLRRALPNTPVILATAEGSTDIAVRAIKAGAFDFLPKPVDEARLLAAVTKALEQHRLLERMRKLEAGDGGATAFEGMIGASGAMRTLFRIVQNVAPTDVSVLVSGESGTGKELVARAIHRLSARSRGPWVALNMAALPKELVESTLFGHERGAFTGADRARRGVCEEAGGGTLFLDEIGEMPVDLQPKLLRVLQERVFRRVGGSQDLPADLRIVSATNRDPLAEVRAGRLRADLYYRLNVIPIELPPLRQRREDIPLIARHALAEYSARYARGFESIAHDAVARLTRMDWPGNVRQLRHAIERIVVLNAGPTLTGDMVPADPAEACPADVQHAAPGDRQPGTAPATPVPPATPAAHVGAGSPVPPAATVPPERAAAAAAAGAPRSPDEIIPLAELERRAIEQALAVCKGSAPDAAERLGISPATIYRRIKERDAKAGLNG